MYKRQETRRFDVIVGNPPYGKIKLDEETRKLYSRSLYGHANLYGLFIDASLRILQSGGLVGFVTPTSFLGGKYFSNLRKLLVEENPPLAIDFISMRSGVFDLSLIHISDRLTFCQISILYISGRRKVLSSMPSL